MAKKKKHEEHENHERWLVSYADFITLLFAFFVVLYSVSRVDNKKMAQASNAIKWALHYEGTGGVGQLPLFEGPPSEGGCSANIGTGHWNSPQQKKLIEAFRKKVERRLKPFIMDKQTATSVVIAVENNRLSVRLAATRFFDPSAAALRPESLPILDAIGDELAGMNRTIRIEGHTDDTPVAGTRYRNNWDLSSARAATVVSYLEQAHGIPAELLAAAGLASAHPVVPNDTPDHREQNRRVEIIIALDPTDMMNFAAAK